MSATFGDCKNNNNGKHQGYDCPLPVTNPVDTTGGGSDVPTVVTDPVIIN